MLKAVREPVQWSTFKIRAIRDLLHATAELPNSRELAEIIFVNPYCHIGDLVDPGIAKGQTTSSYLNYSQIKSGRENHYINRTLLGFFPRESA